MIIIPIKREKGTFLKSLKIGNKGQWYIYHCPLFPILRDLRNVPFSLFIGIIIISKNINIIY